MLAVATFDKLDLDKDGLFIFLLPPPLLIQACSATPRWSSSGAKLIFGQIILQRLSRGETTHPPLVTLLTLAALCRTRPSPLPGTWPSVRCLSTSSTVRTLPRGEPSPSTSPHSIRALSDDEDDRDFDTSLSARLRSEVDQSDRTRRTAY
jgi:hypothetical protein